jgi:hypothetical protein
MGSFNIDVYDDWLTTDVVGQLAWKELYEFEWIESLIRTEHPHLDDEDVAILAEERQRNGYYSQYDF